MIKKLFSPIGVVALSSILISLVTVLYLYVNYSTVGANLNETIVNRYVFPLVYNTAKPFPSTGVLDIQTYSDFIETPYSILFILLPMYLCFLFDRKRMIAFVPLAIGVASVITILLKKWLAVPRPTLGLIHETGYAFPSFHVTYVFAIWALLFYIALYTARSIGAVIGWITFLFLGLLYAMSIAYSRVFLVVHTMFDVFAGACVGIFGVSFVILMYHLLFAERDDVSPVDGETLPAPIVEVKGS